MKQLLVLLCCVMCMALSSCYNGASDTKNAEVSDDEETTVEELVGRWERRSAEAHYTLYLASDGTGKLVSYEQAATTTQTFRYTVTDNKFVARSNKLKKETYHVMLTVDGQYAVFDNGSSVYVYKRRGE